MHSIALERFPLPQFYTYTLFSFLSLISSILHASCVFFITSSRVLVPSNNISITHNSLFNTTQENPSSPLEALFVHDGIFHFIYMDKWCFWSLLNIVYCLLVWVGKSLQGELFGELHDHEQQHIRDKFWNFVFYRVIFLYGILNIQTPLESTLWTGWSSLLGFLHILTHLCKDRFEFLIQSKGMAGSDVSRIIHSHQQSIVAKQWRIILLLVAVFIFGLLLGVVSVIIGIFSSIHLMSFMLAEVIQLQVVTVYVVLRYSIHLSSDTSKNNDTSERIAWYDYNATYYYKMTSWGIDFAHHIHMILWSSLSFNVSTLVIMLHLQYLYQELSIHWKHHREFERAFTLLRSGHQSHSLDPCAICWETLGTHRLLPCGHGFHMHCVLLWLSQSCTCPTCRQNLLSFNENDPSKPTTESSFMSSRLSNKTVSNQLSEQGNVTASSSLTLNDSADHMNNADAMPYSDRGMDNNKRSCPSLGQLLPRIEFEDTNNVEEDVKSDRLENMAFNSRSRSSPQLLTGPMQVELDWHGEFLHSPHLKHSS